MAKAEKQDKIEKEGLKNRIMAASRLTQEDRVYLINLVNTDKE